MNGIVLAPKGAGQLRLDKTTLAVAPETLVQRIHVDRIGNGAIEAVPNNDNAEVCVDDSDIVVTGRKNGSMQIQVRALDGTNYGRTKTHTLNVTLTEMPSKTLADNSWSVIQRIVRGGFARIAGWAPGDKIPRELSGVVGICDTTGSYYDVLLDLDNSAAMPGHHADFGLAWYAADKTTQITFKDAEYGGKAIAAGAFSKLTEAHNALVAQDGLCPDWLDSDLRVTVQGFLDTIVDTELRGRITPSSRFLDVGVPGQSPRDIERLEVITDQIWIPTAQQVGLGGYGSTPKSDRMVGRQFPVLRTNASRLTRPHNDLSGDLIDWHLASRKIDDVHAHTVSTSGGLYGIFHTTVRGVRVCYTIA